MHYFRDNRNVHRWAIVGKNRFFYRNIFVIKERQSLIIYNPGKKKKKIENGYLSGSPRNLNVTQGWFSTPPTPRIETSTGWHSPSGAPQDPGNKTSLYSF